MLNLAIIGPMGIIGLLLTYFSLLVLSLFLVLKNEKSLFLFAWIILIIFFPFLGSLLYVAKHLINRKIPHNLA